MSETVVNVQTLPEAILKLFPSGKVKIREDNGIVTLIPVKKDEECPLFGFFSDGKLSTEKYMAQKQIEKELER